MCDDAVVRHVHEESRRLSRRTALRVAAGVATGVSATVAAGLAAPASARPGSARRGGGVVDLTHVLSPAFPRWPGNPPMVSVPTSRVGGTGSASGFATNWVSFAEHSGTHVDAPAHRIGGGITVERIPAEDLVGPLAVISIAARARTDPRARLGIPDIEDHERRHGPIPGGALVAVHTGWEPRSGGAEAAGFAGDAVDWLIAERNVVAIGTDTLSVDTGGSVDAHQAILGSGRYAVEALANLDRVPRQGATVVVGAPRFAGGTGGPARVLALV